MSEEIPLEQLESLVDPLLDLCREAGEAICTQYDAPGSDQYESKGDKSPLTRADILSHKILRSGLSGLGPKWQFLSEESSPQKLEDRHGWQQFWLVDPLDGTKEFLARTGEFTINIALIADSRPVLGVLFLPLREQAYVGIPGRWARRYRRRAGAAWQSEEITARALQPDRPIEVLVSRRHMGRRLDGCLAWLRDNWGEVERVNSGSALKFCWLAEGRGDFYPRFSPCCEWDTAAGQALLEAAGGALLGLDGQPLTYNRRDTLLSPYFLAIADRGHPLWASLLDELAFEPP